MQLLGRLLLRCGDAEQALDAFDRAAALQPRADVEADRVLALLALQRRIEALGALHAALGSYAVEPEDALAAAARRFIQASSDHPAWAGLSPKLEVIGEIAASADPASIEIRRGEAVLGRPQVRRGEIDPGLRRFRWRPPAGLEAGPIEVVVGGAPAAPGALASPPDFRLNGRGRFEAGRVRGWTGMAWSPKHPPGLVAADETGHEANIPLRADPETPGRFLFSFDPKRLGLQGPTLDLLAITPDGERRALPDSPVLTALPDPPGGLRLARLIGRLNGRARKRPSGRIDVIVPAYRGLDETLACIQSVLDTVRDEIELIVIDDASPEPALSAALQSIAEAGAITLLRNAENLGFPGAVNRGLSLHPGRDAVILNADAEVFHGWLAGLKAAAYSAPDVGTATPLTNAGSIASHGDGEDGACDEATAAFLARTAALVNEGVRVEAPTGVGFCLYIRRDCLQETGLLDTACFERGYGEENDFCMRAGQLGWRHLIAADVFVRHAGGRSFGETRKALQERNSHILLWRHPDYDDKVQAFIAADPLRAARRRLAEAQLEPKARQAALVVSLDLPGGVERVVRERCEALGGQNAPVLLVRPDEGRTGVRIGLAEGTAQVAYRLPEELDEAESFLRRLKLRGIEIHHFLGLDPAFLERVMGLGAPYEVFLHDHAFICPRLSLLGGDGTYCGEPEIEGCEACVETHGSSLEETLSVAALRERSGRWLAGARRVIAPSRDLQRRMGGHFPETPIGVRPWEPPVAAPPSRPEPEGGVTRVAVVGAIGEQKGYQVLLACARDAASRSLPLEFVVIGYTEDDGPLIDTGKVFVTGRFEDGEIDALIARERPQLGFVPSVTPETWCFSLTHLLRAGLEVTAFDLGAVAERLRAAPGQARLLPRGMDAGALNDALLAAPPPAAPAEAASRRQPADASAVFHSPPAAEAAEPVFSGGPSMQHSQPGLSASAEVLTLNKGVYLFSVKAGSPRRVGEDGDLILPALHVGPGPGISADNLEIMQGLRTEGAWLFEPRDMLVVKVKATPALVLLTSLRGPGMEGLELAVERLDGRPTRRDKAPPPALAAPAAFNPPALIARPSPDPAPEIRLPKGLRTEITLHLSRRGDVAYRDALWARASGESLPIEAFSIAPLEGVSPDQIEYKALSASGAETPWIAGGDFCGTRGVRLPLIGFAVRLSPELAGVYTCEYRGAFRSGKIIGPVSDGAPCQGAAADDWLEGIQLSLVPSEIRRPAPAARRVDDEAPAAAPAPAPAAPIGPRFSVFREEVQ
jgi:GT2 family glycosyltransferase/glycosyltransferase involved in cell wall biosynthesis